MKRTPCAATFPVYCQKKYNKRGGWRCGPPWLVSTFLADNKACLCLDEPLWALSFNNPRPRSLCFADPLCQWIKIWAERMDSTCQHYFIKCSRTHQRLVRKQKNKNKQFVFHLWLINKGVVVVCFVLKVKTVWKKNHLFTCQTVTFSYISVITEEKSQPQGEAKLTFPHQWSVKQRTKTRCSYKWTQAHNQ